MVAQTEIGSRTLFLSPGPDTALFGAPAADLLRDDRVLAQLRSLLYLVIAGLMIGLGITELSLTWFGLHEGQRWALVALAVSGLAMLPFWALAFRPYLAAGVPLGLFEIPPWIWVPSALPVPAAVLGWIGLR